MTIEEMEDEFIENFEKLEDWLSQYAWLLHLSDEAMGAGKLERIDCYRIRGCQSVAWAECYYDQYGKLFFSADSDALLVKGLLAVIAILVNGRTKEEIRDWNPRFIKSTALEIQLSGERIQGVTSVIQQIKSISCSCG